MSTMPYYMRISMAQKRRAPHATAARNALKKAKAKLVKLYGGDALMIFECNDKGEPVNALDDLQSGKAVTLQMIHEVRPRDVSDWLDAGEYKVMGELVVKLPGRAL